jgi:dipeptidyl aminopeptidase/acylaminoacyl peptidase
MGAMSWVSRVIRPWLALTAAMALAPGTALAAFPGANGRIAYTLEPDSPAPPTIHTVLPSGGNDQTLTTGWQPSWSADGTRIAFVRDVAAPGVERDIFTTAADGSDQQQLTHGDGAEDMPSYSPSGNRIVFRRFVGPRSRIVVMRSDGTDRQMLARVPDGALYAPVWAPNGRHIAYISAGIGTKARLWTMRPDGSHKRLLAAQRHGAFFTDADYSPDSRHIVVNRCGDGGKYCDFQTVVVRADGRRRHHAPCTVDSTAIYSPDGRWITGGGYFPGDPLFAFWARGAPGSCRGLRQVTFPEGGDRTDLPDWQPLPAG